MNFTTARMIKAIIFIPLLSFIGGVIGCGVASILAALVMGVLRFFFESLNPAVVVAASVSIVVLGTLTGMTLAIVFIVRTEIARDEGQQSYGFPVTLEEPNAKHETRNAKRET